LFVTLSAVTVLSVVAWGVTVSPLLDIDHVVVTGTTGHTTAAEVQSAAGIHRGDALAWLDTTGAVSSIEALPYVHSARVEREWPDTVTIRVVERVPVAWMASGNRRALMDRTGRVLESVTTAPAGMPQLASTAAVPTAGRTVAPAIGEGARVAAALGPLARGVRLITVTDAGVSLQLTAGPEVRLGEPDRVAVKVRAAAAVIVALNGAPVQYVDVSTPTNPVAG
jgi:cell division protein FtsQ